MLEREQEIQLAKLGGQLHIGLRGKGVPPLQRILSRPDSVLREELSRLLSTIQTVLAYGPMAIPASQSRRKDA